MSHSGQRTGHASAYINKKENMMKPIIKGYPYGWSLVLKGLERLVPKIK